MGHVSTSPSRQKGNNQEERRKVSVCWTTTVQSNLSKGRRIQDFNHKALCPPSPSLTNYSSGIDMTAIVVPAIIEVLLYPVSTGLALQSGWV